MRDKFSTVADVSGAACIAAGLGLLFGLGVFLVAVGVALLAGSWAVNR